MMKLLLLILLLVLPLSLAAPDEGKSKSENRIQRAIKRHGEHVEAVLEMAKNGEPINGVLRPLSFLGFGSAGFVFKGVRLPDNTSVAIKFISKNRTDAANREYEMYSYLNAINSTKVEDYGIPTVYYYGDWEGLIVTAYTELGKTLADHQRSVQYQNYDYLILIKQFIKQSKCIHSRGIRHNDIKPQNILLRGCESFLIDFDQASKMVVDNRGTTHFYASLNYHRKANRVATDDWESFLYAICEMADITLDWFKEDSTNGTKIEKEEQLKLYTELKANRKRIVEIISQSKSEVIPPIIRAFAEEAFSDKPIPDYDRINKLVTDALEQHFPAVKCFSWTKQNTDRSIVNQRRIFEDIGPSKMDVFKPILHEFAGEIFSGKSIPDHDGIDKLVTDALAKNYPTNICVSWTKKNWDESIKRASTNISDLVIPEDFSEYESFEYPEVNEKFFN